MRKLLSVLVVLMLTLSVFATANAATSVASTLTAEPWKNALGSTLNFNSNGTGTLVGPAGNVTEFTYKTSGNSATYSYKYWGNFTLDTTVVLGEENGIAYLCLNNAGPLTSASWYPQSQIDTVRQMAQERFEPYSIPFGEEIDLGFLKLTLTHMQNTGRITGGKQSSTSYLASDGHTYVVLFGTIRNTGNRELNLKNVRCELTLDNGKLYSSSGAVIYQEELKDVLPPMGTGEFFAYFNVPAAEAKAFKTGNVVLSLKDGLTSNISFAGFGDFIFSLEIDEAMARASQKEPAREKVYFKESPALPTPESYADCYQSSSNVSSSNGKVTKIRYSFRSFGTSDLTDIYNAYKDGLKKDGYTVSGSTKSFTVSMNGKKLAEVTLGTSSVDFNIMTGNDRLSPLQ